MVGKVKDKTANDVIKEFVGLEQKMHLFLVDDSSEHKKQRI